MEKNFKLRSASSSGSLNEDINTKIAANNNERQESQKKTFTKWLNSKLLHAPGSPLVKELFQDLRDGTRLLAFLQYATGKKLKPAKGKLRLHHIQNMNVVLSLLEEEKVKLIGISNTSIVDGDSVPTMGLLWNLIYRFQIQGALAKHLGKAQQVKDIQAEKGLLQWCQDVTAGYKGVEIKNFSKSWKDGLAFNAIFHAARPEAFDYETVLAMSPEERLEHAFALGKDTFGVAALLESGDFEVQPIDKRTVMMYVSTMNDTVATEIDNNNQPVPIEEEMVDAVILENVESVPGLDAASEIKMICSDHNDTLKSLLEKLPPVCDSANLEELHAGLKKSKDTTSMVLSNESHVTSSIDKAHSSMSLKGANKEAIGKAVAELEKTWHSSVDACLSNQARHSDAICRLIDGKTSEIDELITNLYKEYDEMDLSDVSLAGLKANYCNHKEYMIEIDNSEKIVEKWLALCKDDSIQTLNESETTATRRDELLKRWNDLEVMALQRKQDISSSLLLAVDHKLLELNDVVKNGQDVIGDVDSMQDASHDQLKELSASCEEINLELESSADMASSLCAMTKDLKANTAIDSKAAAEADSKAKMTYSKLRQLQADVEDMKQRTSELVKDQMSKRNAMMAELNSKLTKISLWIKNTKGFVSHGKPDSHNLSELTAQREEMEDFKSEVKTFQNVLEGCSLECDSPRFDPSDRSEFKNKIGALDGELSDLDRSLKKCLYETQKQLAAESSIRDTKCVEWESRASAVNKQLLQLEQEAGNLDNVEELHQSQLDNLESHLHDIIATASSLESDADSIDNVGQEMIDAGVLSDKEAGAVRNQMRIALTRCHGLKDNASSKLATIGDVRSHMQDEEKGVLTDWRDQVEEFDICCKETEGSLESCIEDDGSLCEEKVQEITPMMNQLETSRASLSDTGKSALENRCLADPSKLEISNDLETQEVKMQSLHAAQGELSKTAEVETSKRSAVEFWAGRATGALAWMQERDDTLESIMDGLTSLDKVRDAQVRCMMVSEDTSSYTKHFDGIVEDGKTMITTNVASSDNTRSQMTATLVELEDNLCQLDEKTTSVQQSLQDRLRDIGEQDAKRLCEWSAAFGAQDSWLSSIEEELEMTGKKQTTDTIVPCRAAVASISEMESRYLEKVEHLDNMFAMSDTFLTNDAVQSPDVKTRIENDTMRMADRKDKLELAIKDEKTRLTAELERLQAVESLVFDKWMTDANEADILLAKLKEENSNESVNEAESENLAAAKDDIRTWEGLVGRVDAFESGIQALSQRCNDLVRDKTLDTDNEDAMQEKMKSLIDSWAELYEESALTLKGRQEALGELLRADDDRLGYWLNDADSLTTWISSLHDRTRDVAASSSGEESPATLLAAENLLGECKDDLNSESDRYHEILRELDNLDQREEDDDQEDNIADTRERLAVSYDELDEFLKDGFARIQTKLSSQGDELAKDCEAKLQKIEIQAQSQSPVGDSFITLRENEAQLSKTAKLALGLQPDMDQLSQFCNDAMTSNALNDDQKASLQTQQNSLADRYNRMKQHSSASAQRICLAAKEMLLQEMIVLLDKADTLEKSQATLSEEDAMGSDDLRMRLIAIKDILSVCGEHGADAADLQSFVQDLLSSGVFTSADHDDAVVKLKSVGERFDAISTGCKYAENSTYALLMRLLRRKRQDTKERLIGVESSLLDDNYCPDSLADVIDKKRSHTVMCGSLEEAQRSVESTTSLVAGLVADDLIDEDDYSDVQDGNEKNVAHLVTVTETAHAQGTRLDVAARSLLEDRILQLHDWLNDMKPEMEKQTVCGPDLPSIQKQLRQVKDLQDQLQAHRISPLVRHDDPIVATILSQPMQLQLQKAETDCDAIAAWIDDQDERLRNAQKAWDEFRHCEISLLDYLKDKEDTIKDLPPVNLEDGNAVNQRLNALQAINKDMETKKGDVSRLHETSTAVVALLQSNNMPVNNVKAQVADIHDCWNNTVKQVIESKSKLSAASDRIKALEDNMERIRFWLNDTQTVLKCIEKDVSEADWKDLEPQLQKKRDEQVQKQQDVTMINRLRQQIDGDVDEQSRDLIHCDVVSINKDWDTVSRDLSHVPPRRKKKRANNGPCFCWCWRRMLIKYGYYT